MQHLLARITLQHAHLTPMFILRPKQYERQEIGSLKQQKRQWQDAATNIGRVVDATEECLTALTTSINTKVEKLSYSIGRVAGGTQNIQRVKNRLAILILRLKVQQQVAVEGRTSARESLTLLYPNFQDAERLNKELLAKSHALESHYQSTTSDLAQLKQEMEVEVERRCTPLRDELAQAQVIVQSLGVTTTAA